ncbi:MAG: hypothetical protein ACKOB1_12710, partial [Planctomycetia bacterium]
MIHPRSASRLASGLVPWMLVLGLAGHAGAADTPAAGAAAPPPLASREQELARQFRDLERTFLRLADLMAANDPRRSALLRDVFARAREEEVGDRLDVIVSLLEQGQLLKAGSSQATAIEKLQELLGLLEAGDTERQRATAKEEVKKFLSRVAKAIAKQRDIEGSTEAGGDAEKLAGRQEKLAEETAELARDIEGFAKRMDASAGGDAGKAEAGEPADTQKQAEGGEKADGSPKGGKQDSQGGEQESRGGEQEAKGGEQGSQSGKQGGQSGEQGEQSGQQSGQPCEESEAEGGEKPIEGDDEASRAARTKQRLEAAKRRMQKAKEQLDEARRRDARGEQEKAVEELETARAELEEILRQLREEEVEKLLVQLEARLRAMLRAEKAVLAGIDKLAAEKAADQSGADRERQLEAARLGREQAAIGVDAGKALVLVRDDGSAVAIPEALEQVRDDATQAAARLGRGDTGETTRGLVQDLVANLEEMLGALEKAQKEQQARQQGGAGGRPAQPGEQPLVDKISELKMIRSLQMRVNTRTKRFAQLLTDGVERPEEPELLRAIERLAERQHTIERAARDIVTGRTE